MNWDRKTWQAKDAVPQRIGIDDFVRPIIDGLQAAESVVPQGKVGADTLLDLAAADHLDDVHYIEMWLTLEDIMSLPERAL